MALALESAELADEPGGALEGAIADLQRWQRGRAGRAVEAAVQFDDMAAIPGDGERCPPFLLPSSSTV